MPLGKPPLPRTEENRLLMQHPSCRARLSPRQKELLNRSGKLQLATNWIQQLHKVHGSTTVGSDFRRLEVINGVVRIADENGKVTKHTVAHSGGSINYTVCGAVLRGYLVNEPRNQPYLPDLTVGVTGQTKRDEPKTPGIDLNAIKVPGMTTISDRYKYTDKGTFDSECAKIRVRQIDKATAKYECSELVTLINTELSNESVPVLTNRLAGALALSYLFDLADGSGDDPFTFEDKKEEEPPKIMEPFEALMIEFHRLRDYCENDDKSTDNISTGSMLRGFQMVEAGFPQEAIVHALTINWPVTVRDSLGIKKYDPTSFKQGTANGYHKLAPYVAELARIRIPVLLSGPTQSGKSHLAEDVAKILELPYGGACPLTGGASPSWLLGRDTRNGYLPAAMITTYQDGGVFLLDEMDAADSNMLIVLNNAVTNGYFDHPFLGRIKKHPDFVLIAAANTWGTGATSQYRGRSKLDAATLERFRLGRVEIDYDRSLERKLMEKYRDKETKTDAT